MLEQVGDEAADVLALPGELLHEDEGPGAVAVDDRVRVFVDNLFSATELMAKGMLIWQPDRSLLESTTHRFIKVRFNQERKHVNVDGHFVDLLNRLGKLREPARYLARDFELSETEMAEMLTVAEEMHARAGVNCRTPVVATSPRRAPVNN